MKELPDRLTIDGEVYVRQIHESAKDPVSAKAPIPPTERKPIVMTAEQKAVFAGAKWKTELHLRTAEADFATYSCDALGLIKKTRTEHLDPDNPTGMYHNGKTKTSYWLENDDRVFGHLAEVAEILIQRAKAEK